LDWYDGSARASCIPGCIYAWSGIVSCHLATAIVVVVVVAIVIVVVDSHDHVSANSM
jgi:hypothetical protein